MKMNTDALKRRWADPVYRDRQVAANRLAAAERRAHFADPLARRQHGLAIKVGHRMRKTTHR